MHATPSLCKHGVSSEALRSCTAMPGDESCLDVQGLGSGIVRGRARIAGLVGVYMERAVKILSHIGFH